MSNATYDYLFGKLDGLSDLKNNENYNQYNMSEEELNVKFSQLECYILSKFINDISNGKFKNKKDIKKQAESIKNKILSYERCNLSDSNSSCSSYSSSFS